MDIIVPFEDVFPAVGERSVAQQKAQTSELQIFLVVARYSIADESQANLIVLAMPLISRVIRAQRNRLIDLGVGERLVPPFVPPEPAKGPHVRRHLLFQINAKPILHCSLLPRGYDVGSRRFSRQE